MAELCSATCSAPAPTGDVPLSKKSIRDFAELRSLLKKTETEAEAKAVIKGGSLATAQNAEAPDRGCEASPDVGDE